MAMRLDHGTDELEEIHEINVTPFIDVILVLLIIFMVAAPLATVDIAVDLPSSNAEPQQHPDKPVYLTLRPDLTLAVGDDAVMRDALTSALDAATRRQPRAADVPARRPKRALRRGDARDERVARRALSESRAGRAGNARGQMTTLSPPWLEDESPRGLWRWIVAGAIVVGVHAAIVAYVLAWPQPQEIGDDTEAITVELAPIELDA